MENITKIIIQSSDQQYKDFQLKLVPTNDNIIGLRVPKAKEIAKKYANTEEGMKFLDSLPHTYYDENLVHGLMIGYLKNDTKKRLDEFIPFLDNWAVVDTMTANLKQFFKKTDWFNYLFELLRSRKEFVIRFSLVAMLDHYVDVHTSEIIELLPDVKDEFFYVQMAVAWLVSVLLVKHYDEALVLLEKNRLSKWIHNKSIQKSLESFRISPERKEYLKSLRLR